MTKRSILRSADGAAFGLSGLCLVHCLMLPFLVLAFPAVAGLLGHGESFHLFAVLIAVPLSATAILIGLRRHGAASPLLFAGPGAALLILAVTVAPEGAAETVLSVAGSLLLAAAHLRNWRLARS